MELRDAEINSSEEKCVTRSFFSDSERSSSELPNEISCEEKGIREKANDSDRGGNSDLPQQCDLDNNNDVSNSLDNKNDLPEGCRYLSDDEKERYKNELNCSDNFLNDAYIDSDGVLHVKTINEGKEGTMGENGVLYERKTVVINGIKVEGVFPKFDSKFTTDLPSEMYSDSDAKQFKYCNDKLKEAVENDPELAKQFTPEQLEQIKNGDTPSGYTWHHNEEAGKIELVYSYDHSVNRHTGGKSIWGGGQSNR